MVELLNWPPSRGENPHEHRVRILTGDLVREDVDFETTEQEERQIIDAYLAKGGRPPVGPPPEDVEEDSDEEGPFDRGEPRAALVGCFSCDYHVATVASLTLEQADRLLVVVDEPDPGAAEVVKKHAVEVDAATFAMGFAGVFHSAACYRWHNVQPRTLRVLISYPLSKAVRLTVPPMKRESLPCAYCVETGRHGDGEEHVREDMTPGYLLWLVAREYVRIYEEHEHYGVWGHAMDDLYFESLDIDADGNVELGIGS